MHIVKRVFGAQRRQQPAVRKPANPTPSAAAPAPAPAPKGWPHAIVSGSAAGCARDPLPDEVIVFRDSAFTGACAILHEGFYPQADNFLIGNDAMTSLKVGSAVRARLFRDAVYAGGWTVYPGGSVVPGLATWNDVVSSIRVEPARRSQICDDVQQGEIALYSGLNYTGDCVVLPGDTSYADSEVMGIANDSIESTKNRSERMLLAYRNISYEGLVVRVSSGDVVSNLHDSSRSISSIQMLSAH
jgi:hypothetical protein